MDPKAFGIFAKAIKSLDENATVYNVVTNHGPINGNASVQNYQCTFNPLDKLMEVIEKNEKLYKDLLKEKDEKIAMLQKGKRE